MLYLIFTEFYATTNLCLAICQYQPYLQYINVLCPSIHQTSEGQFIISLLKLITFLFIEINLQFMFKKLVCSLYVGRKCVMITVSEKILVHPKLEKNYGAINFIFFIFFSSQYCDSIFLHFSLLLFTLFWVFFICFIFLFVYQYANYCDSDSCCSFLLFFPYFSAIALRARRSDNYSYRAMQKRHYEPMLKNERKILLQN